MNPYRESPFVNLKHRLCFNLAISEGEADRILNGDFESISAANIARRVNLDPVEVAHIIHQPSTLEEVRADPNRISAAQIWRIPGMNKERVRAVSGGRPYFSIDELEAASGIPSQYLEELFEIPALTLRDRVTGRTQSLTCVQDKYILRPRLDFEGPERLANLGFANLIEEAAAPIRVVGLSDLERARAHELKAEFGGQVFPVLRDAEGVERFLIPGSIEIWYPRNYSAAQAQVSLDNLGLVVTTAVPEVGFFQAELLEPLVDLDITRQTLEKVEAVNQLPEVLFAEPSQVGFADFGPDNTTAVLTFESVSGHSRDWNHEAIGLDAAHEIAQGSQNVTIFVIDSGMRLDHPDLAGALRQDWNSLDLNFDLGVPISELSPEELRIAHGTQVAGLAGGRALDASYGARGVAPGSWVLPVKISGAPLVQSYGFRAAAIRQVVDYIETDQRGVINISWSTNGEHLGIREALIEASNCGLGIATSAGNFKPYEDQFPDIVHYPSCYALGPADSEADVASRRKIRGLCSVAALNAGGLRASYSYYGARSVTVSAPGGEHGGSGAGIFLATTPENYIYGAGTSFAAPHVAGLMALLFSLDSTLSAQRAIEIIRETATDVDQQNPAYQGMLGAGLINARAALEAVSSSTGTATEVPADKVLEPVGKSTEEPTQPIHCVNINKASAEEIDALPLIGPWTAQRIVSYRDAHGPFATVWDLTRTGVIDTWTLLQLQELVTLDAAIASGESPSAALSTAAEESGHLVNFNVASAEEMASLPLIGPWTAQRIVSYRDAHGSFATVWDLTRTGVIDTWTLLQLQELVST